MNYIIFNNRVYNIKLYLYIISNYKSLLLFKTNKSKSVRFINFLYENFVFAIFLLLSLLLFAIVGYKYISGLSWIDSIYMAIITISFVGFEELDGTSESKIFVIILVISSAIILGYSIKIITEYIVSLYSEKIKDKKMQKNIDNLDNHTIVCGYGKNGSQVVKKLAAYGKSFVIIEKNDAIINKDISDEISRS